MKIAFFVQYCHEAGTYFRWHNLAKALVLNGNCVHIYAGDFNYKARKRIEIRDGVEYRITPSLISSRIFGNPSDPLTAIYRCFTKVDKGYDVYHLFQPFLQAYMPWQWLKYFRKGFFVYDWDDLWIGGLFASKPKLIREQYTISIVNYLERKLPTIADATTICSTYLYNLISPKVQKYLLYNGFWDRENLVDKSILRSKWNFDNSIFYLGYIGKTASEIDWIKSGIIVLEKSGIIFKLLIAGPPKEQIKTIGLNNHDNVLFLGEVSSTDAAELAKSVDLGLMPLEDNNFNKSRFPIKFFDFLSVGTPIYFSGVGEVQKISSKIAGAIEGASNKEEWVSHLPEVVKSVINNSQFVKIDDLTTNYSWTAIAYKLAEFYQSEEIS